MQKFLVRVMLSIALIPLLVALVAEGLWQQKCSRRTWIKTNFQLFKQEFSYAWLTGTRRPK